MAKTLFKWLDEFVERGANPDNVIEWPESAGGGVVHVDTLPETGQPHTVYQVGGTEPYTWMFSDNYALQASDVVFHSKYGIIVVDSDEQMNSILESVGSDNVSGGALYFYNRIEDKITKAEPQGAYGFTKTEQTKNAPYSFTISNDEEQVKNFYVLQSFDFAEQGKLPDGTSVTLSETENEGLILKQLPMNGYSQLYYFYCSDLVSVEDARSLTADEIMQYQITPHTLPSFFSIVDGAVATIEGDSPNYRFDSHENMFIDPHTGEQYHGTVNWMMYVYDIIHNLDYEGMVSDNNGERVFNPALQDSEYYIYSDGQWYNMDDLGSGDDTYYLWQRSSNTTWAELPENVNYVISRYQGETPSAELAAGFCTLHYFKNLTDVSNLHVGDTLEMSVFGQGLDTFTITVDMVGDGWFRAQYGLNYNYYKRTGSCTNTFAHYDAIKWIPTLKWLESTEDGTFNPPFNYDGFNGAYFHKAMDVTFPTQVKVGAPYTPEVGVEKSIYSSSGMSGVAYLLQGTPGGNQYSIAAGPYDLSDLADGIEVTLSSGAGSASWRCIGTLIATGSGYPVYVKFTPSSIGADYNQDIMISIMN